jgi:hypothetical protein
MKVKPWHWITLQLVLFFPFIHAMTTVIGMSVAEPIGGYLDKSGRYIECEAVSPPTKHVREPTCAPYGSKETNPKGYLIAWFGVVSIGSILYISSRPGRGMRITRSSPKVNIWKGPI